MSLDDLRKEINALNEELLTLFKRRMAVSKKVAEEKAHIGKAVYDAKRERDILDMVTAKAGHDMDLYARRFFQNIFSLSRTYQAEQLFKDTEFSKRIERAVKASPKLPPQRGAVACAGIFGSNAQLACDKLLPLSQILYVNSFASVFEAVESGVCEFGVLPIENSSNGSVKEVYDLLEKKNCYIVRATKQWISHDLLAVPQASLDTIRTIYSHPQALGQCSTFLKGLEHVELKEYANTAMAAQFVAESKDPTIAAIAAPICADIFNLTPLAKHIQNNDNNYTRFICIAKTLTVYPGANKISLVSTAQHTPGGLVSLLSKFADLGMNLTKLESRPIEGHNFEFLFYLDLEASLIDPNVRALLSELDATQDKFRLLGNYPES